MDFQKFEEKLLENGAVFSFDGDGSEIKKIWFVWYRKINSDSFNVMLNTGCSDKLYAEQRKDKLVNNGILNKSFVVYGLSDLDLTNGKLTLDVKKEQKEQNKEQDQYIQKIAKCVRKDFLSNVNYISQIGLDEFVVLDTETTGIGKMDEVVELAALRLKNYKVIGKFHSYINPGVPISPKAFEVHGLTKEFLAEKGRNAKDVFEEFKIFVNGSPIVGHNVNFDKDKIENHSKKSKVKIDLNVILLFIY